MTNEKNELLSIQLTQPIITTREDFNAKLKFISQLATAAKNANDDFELSLKDPNSELDEEKLNNTRATIKEASDFIKEAKESRLQIKKAYDNARNDILKLYDEQLKNSNYNALLEEDIRAKQFQKDGIAHRVNKRWAELKITFDANIELYSKIKELTPKLAEFSNFRLTFPKLVSGAKASKITDKARSFVSNTLNEYNETILNIESNSWNLTEYNKQRLLNQFENQPDTAQVLNWAQMLVQQQQIEEEMKKAQEKAEKEKAELKKKQQEEADKKALEAKTSATQANTPKQPETMPQASKTTPEATQPIAPQQTSKIANASTDAHITSPIKITVDPFKEITDYIIINPKYKDIKTNETTKLNLIFDLVNQSNQKDSMITKNVKSPKEFNDILRFILN